MQHKHKDCIGREKLIADIMHNIDSRQSSAVIGAPGSGKTTVHDELLKRLATANTGNRLVLDIAIVDVENPLFFALAIIRELRKGLERFMDREKLDDDGLLVCEDCISDLSEKENSTGSGMTPLISVLRETLRACKEDLNLDITLVIDRFHHFGNLIESSFYTNLKTFSCCYVIFSNRPVQQIEFEVAQARRERSSTFYEKLMTLYCPSFSQPEFEEYLEGITPPDGRISQSYRNLLSDYAGTFPFPLDRIYHIASQSGYTPASVDIDRAVFNDNDNILNIYRSLFNYITSLSVDEAEIRENETKPGTIGGKRKADVFKLISGDPSKVSRDITKLLLNLGLIVERGSGYDLFAPEFREYFLSCSCEALDFAEVWSRVETESRALIFAALKQVQIADGFQGTITDFLCNPDGYLSLIQSDGGEAIDKSIVKRLTDEFRSADETVAVFPTNPSELWGLFFAPMYDDYFKPVLKGSYDDWSDKFKLICYIRNKIAHNNTAEIERLKGNGDYSRGIDICNEILERFRENNANPQAQIKGETPLFPPPAAIAGTDSLIGTLLLDRYYEEKKAKGYSIFGILDGGKWLPVDRNDPINGKLSADEVGKTGIRVSYSLKKTSGRDYAINIKPL